MRHSKSFTSLSEYKASLTALRGEEGEDKVVTR